MDVADDEIAKRRRRRRRQRREGRRKEGKGRGRDFSTDQMWSSGHECRAYYWATHYPVIRPTGSLAIIGNSLLRCLVEAVFNGPLNESRATFTDERWHRANSWPVDNSWSIVSSRHAEYRNVFDPFFPFPFEERYEKQTLFRDFYDLYDGVGVLEKLISFIYIYITFLLNSFIITW